MSFPFSFPNTHTAGGRVNADLWQEDLDALQNEFPLSADYFSNGVFSKCVILWDSRIPIWAFAPEIAKRRNLSEQPLAPPLGWHSFDPLYINCFKLLFERTFADEISVSGKRTRIGRVGTAMKNTVPTAFLLDGVNFEVHQATWDGDQTGGQWKLYSTAAITQYRHGGNGAIVSVPSDLASYRSAFSDAIRLKDGTVLVAGRFDEYSVLWTVDGTNNTPIELESHLDIGSSQGGGMAAGVRPAFGMPSSVAKLYPNYTGDFVYAFRYTTETLAQDGKPAPQQPIITVAGARIKMKQGARFSVTARELGGMVVSAHALSRTGEGIDGTVIYPFGRKGDDVGSTTCLPVAMIGPTITAWVGDHGNVEEDWNSTIGEILDDNSEADDYVNDALPYWRMAITELPNNSDCRVIQNFRTYLFCLTTNSSGLHWALVVPRSTGEDTATVVCSGSYTTGKGTDWNDVVPRSGTTDGNSVYAMLDNGKVWRWDLRLAAKAAGSQGEVIIPRAASTVTTTEEYTGLADEGDRFDSWDMYWSNASYALNGVVLNRFSDTGDGDISVIGSVK